MVLNTGARILTSAEHLEKLCGEERKKGMGVVLKEAGSIFKLQNKIRRKSMLLKANELMQSDITPMHRSGWMRQPL